MTTTINDPYDCKEEIREYFSFLRKPEVKFKIGNEFGSYEEIMKKLRSHAGKIPNDEHDRIK